MLYQLANQTSHVNIPAEFDDYVDSELTKLAPIMASFPDNTMLRVVVDDASGSDDIEIGLRLSLPNRLLTSRETGSVGALRSVFDKALKNLRRQLLDLKGQS